MSTARVMIVEDDRVIARRRTAGSGSHGHPARGRDGRHRGSTTSQVLPSLVDPRAEHVEKRQTLQLGTRLPRPTPKKLSRSNPLKSRDLKFGSRWSTSMPYGASP